MLVSSLVLLISAVTICYIRSVRGVPLDMQTSDFGVVDESTASDGKYFPESWPISLSLSLYNQSIVAAKTKDRHLRYGPAVGIDPRHIHTTPKNFDDTRMLIYGENEFRYLKKIRCFHRLIHHDLVGLKETYARPDGSERIHSGYHGFYPPETVFGLRDHAYELKLGEKWSVIEVKSCGPMIKAIHFGSNGRHNGVSCGTYYEDSPGCTRHTLIPPKGQYIVGLFGAASSTWLVDHEGVRAIGLITLPL